MVLISVYWSCAHCDLSRPPKPDSLSANGAVQIDKVAGPVGEALVMTAVGLTVAIPAVLAFNGFNRPGANVSQGLIDDFYRLGMQSDIKSSYDCIKAFSETDLTADLQKITAPILFMLRRWWRESAR